MEAMIGALLAVAVWLVVCWLLDGLVIPTSWPSGARTFTMVVLFPLAFLAVLLLMFRIPRVEALFGP